MKRRTTAAKALLLHGTIWVAIALTLYPVLWVVKMSLSKSQAFGLSASLLPDEVTLSNYVDFLTATDSEGHWLFGWQLLNSVVVSAGTTLLGIFLSCTAAYAFSRFRFPGRRTGLLVFLVTQMFPGVMMAIPVYILLDALGLLENLFGLVLVYSITAIPFCVFMLKGYFDTIPRELEEAAIMDGASQFTLFWRIVLPLARPAIAVTALFSFMTAWNEFILAATFMSEEIHFTLPVALQRYVGDYSTEWGRFAAGALLVSLPVVVLFFALQRYLVGGLTAGSVKG
ncbi:MAG: sugar ABC transporter permease [Deltaproteobacteria bacterium]|nr:MAG: sugar ABC transporter permease [Deltaproteobacteria bacterium]